MVLPWMVDAWNIWTDFTWLQDFIDESRRQGHHTKLSRVVVDWVHPTGIVSCREKGVYATTRDTAAGCRLGLAGHHRGRLGIRARGDG